MDLHSSNFIKLLNGRTESFVFIVTISSSKSSLKSLSSSSRLLITIAHFAFSHFGQLNISSFLPSFWWHTSFLPYNFLARACNNYNLYTICMGGFSILIGLSIATSLFLKLCCYNSIERAWPMSLLMTVFVLRYFKVLDFYGYLHYTLPHKSLYNTCIIHQPVYKCVHMNCVYYYYPITHVHVHNHIIIIKN